MAVLPAPFEMVVTPIATALPPGTVLDGIEVVGSLVGTRQDLAEAFDFGARGIVVPVVQTRALDEVGDIFEEMHAGKIQGRMVLDMKKSCGHNH